MTTQSHEFNFCIKKRNPKLDCICIGLGGFRDVRTMRDDSSEEYLESARRDKGKSDQTSLLQALGMFPIFSSPSSILIPRSAGRRVKYKADGEITAFGPYRCKTSTGVELKEYRISARGLICATFFFWLQQLFWYRRLPLSLGT